MNHHSKGFVVQFLLVVIGLVAIGGVYLYMQKMEPLSEIPENQSPSASTKISQENLQDLEPGTKIGTMTVISVERYFPQRTDIPLASNASVVFSGEVTIAGTYEYSDEAAFWGGEACFTPDEDSRDRLPHFSDSSRGFLCFTNKEEAASLLGPKETTAQATIVIDSFNLVYAETATWNTAKLTGVK